MRGVRGAWWLAVVGAIACGGSSTGEPTESDTSASTPAGTTGTTSDTGTPPGPCEGTIPADAVTVDADLGDATNQAVFWVCAGATLTYSGNGGTIFVEPDGDAEVRGTGNTVWIADGGWASLFEGGNTAYYVSPTNVGIPPGGTTTQVRCTTLTFDTTGAPAPGCTP